MKKCCWCDSLQAIEWHHALLYAGRQVDEWYAILPLCQTCHRGDFGTLKREIKDYCQLIAIIRGLKELLKKYPKRDWIWEKNFLATRVVKKYAPH